MLLKEWAYKGTFDFYTNRLRLLATNELTPEKWSYSDATDFGILARYIDHTFEKLWDERELADEAKQQELVYMDDSQACFNTGLYDKMWQPIYFYCTLNHRQGYQKWQFTAFF